ncbi:tenascin-X isoform X3 [Bos javanicus]|uniref:tenascin-X isoform X3 n=1 Tax=Bos javanicus TaxID=9906 RepID=UPI002AA67C07|nr:tenascin-X isoform X3 [Bos javanicus]
MPTQCSLTSNLALLMLLGTVTAGPFSPRSNMTLPAPRPPPQPGGRTVQPEGGGPSSRLYEHTVEGGEKQVVFTHRINLPPSAGCGCPPGTEPPVPASEVQALRVRLEILEELVKGLKEQCTGGCCPPAAQAGTGQTDIRSLCSLHGVFDLSRCACSCEPGWGGPTCSDPEGAEGPPSSPPSAPGSCPDDCNDQGRCVRGRCVCFPGYTGPSCSWPSCPGDCHGRGRCVQGVCVCRSGFSGDDCSVRSCPRGCSQRGRCEDGRCVCNPGYSGEDCGVRSCPRDCSQRGRCENGRCVCNPGYTGDDCGVRSCPRGCSQKGRCEDGRCVCDPGYTGDDCGSRTCPWDCGEGGRCVDGRCVCWPGYAGEDCSTRTCPRDCRGRGRCEDGECICDPGYSGDDCGVRSCPSDCNQRGRCEDGRCVCWPGYSGPDCGARACPRDCRGRGRCENGVCVCHAGYSGEDCGVRSCPGDCRGRGRCESGRCVCWPGYTGRDCGTRACPGDCRGRGRCVDGRCVCNPGFAGEDCGSRRCPGDCRGRGRCEDGVCSCDVGYEGEDCGKRSCPRGCQGRGQCLEGRCVCDDGYEGEDCGVRRCPRDCNQRGVCQDGVCTCWEGFAGEDCGLRVCPSNCHRRGRCENGRCVCDSGYTGPSCATRTCPADCRGRGRCVQGVCVCHVGYSGEDCGQEEPPASACPGGCGPRELCSAGQCVCVEGFRGPDCAIQTCPGDCRGRGECREGSCVCQDGYAGEDCGEEVPAIEGMRMHLLEETTVRTEWTRAPGNVDAYEIQFIPTTEGASPPFTARVPSSASAYDQRGLAPGQEYQVTVRALRGTNWGPPASKTITTMIDGPQDLRVVAVTPTTLELNWLRPQAEVDRFVVSYVSAGNQRVRLEVPSEADGTLLTGLMPGVEYVVTVTAERGRAVSYPASIRANTAPGHYSYPEAHPPAPPPKPRPRPAPAPRPPRPARPAPPPRPSRPAEQGEAESPPRPSPPQPPRRAWGNLTAELGRFRGTVQDLERHLRAHGYPLRANQTYTSVAHHIHEYLQRRRSPAPPPGRPHPTASPDSGTWKRSSNQGIYGLSPEGVDRVATPRHPKPEVLGTSADGALLVSLDGLRGHFERVVLRWRPQPPAEGPAGELTVPGTARTVSLPDLKPGTTYHVEVHGVRAGQTSKSYAFITTTGSSLSGLLGATDEPPPSGPSTTQGAQAPVLQQRPQELAELRVLGKDKTGRLRVAWTAQPDTFTHFQLRLRVPEGPGAHEELLPGDVRQALVPSPPPESPYELSLRGIPPSGEPSAPLIYQGIMDKDGEKPGKPLAPPRLGKLTVTDVTSDSLLLHWTVPEGEFDSFVIQYKDRDRPQVVPVEGPQRSALISNLDVGRKYKFVLYGLVGKKRHGPLVAEAKISPEKKEEPRHPEPPERPLLGELTVAGATADSLRLSWTVAQGSFDSFVVQYKDAQGRPQAVPVTGDENEVAIPGLEPDRKYKMNLYGLHGRQRVGPVSVVATTAPQEVLDETPSATEMEETPSPTEPSTKAPESPEKPLLGELMVTGSSPDSLSLSWTIPQGHFDSFTVQYRDGDGQPRVMRVPGDEDGVTISGLEPDHKYKMNLYGFHDRQRVGPMSVIGVTTAEEETPSPTEMEETPSPMEPSTEAPEPAEEPLLGELTVTGSSPDSLSLSWTVPQGHFDSFTVQYKGRDGPQVVRVRGEETEVTIGGLEPGRKYKMNLYGLHGGQRSGPVSTVGMTAPQAEETPPATEPPKEPRLGELTVTDVTPNSVGLAWTVSEGQFDSFMVQYKDRDGQPHVVPVAADQREATVSGLEPERKYRMNVYGLHGGQRVGPLSVVALTAPVPPDPVTEPPVEPRLGELTVTDVTPDSVGLSWTVPEGEFDSFLVQYKDRDGQPQVVPVATDQREVTIPGLEPSRKYKFLLFGIQDGKRRSTVSVEAKTVGRGDASPGAPPRLGELWVTDPTPDSLRLSWTVPEGHFDSFVVQFKDRDGPRVVSVEGHERSVTISPLDSGRKYRFLVYGLLGKRRHGPLTTEGTTETRRAVDEAGTKRPSKPRLGEELQVTGVTSDSVGLSWTVPEGHFDSFVIQYRDRDGQPQVVPVEGSRREVSVSGLDPARRYKLLLYGLSRDKRVGPISAIAVTEPAPREEIKAEPATFSPPASEPLLGEVILEEAAPHSLRLSWTATEGEFDSFEVQYTDENGQLQEVNVGGDQHDITISDLESDHRYLVSLYGFHDGQRVGPAHIEAMTAPREEDDEPSESPSTTQTPSTEVPEPHIKPRLGELAVTDTTPNSLSLSWTVPEGQFDHFLIQYKNGDGQPKVVRVPGDEDEVTISGLEPDHKYKMNLYGFHDRQRMGPVSVIGVTTAEEETPSPTEMEETPSPTEPNTEVPEPPEEPFLEELTVTGSSPDSLSLSWTVPQGHFDSFTVQYKNGDGQPKVVRVPGHDKGVTISGLEPDHKYKMNLYGFHDRQRVGPVSVIGVTTAEEETPSPTEVEETPSPTEPSTEAPEPPEEPVLGELMVTGSSPDSLSLSWTVPQGHFDSFTVQYKGRDGPQVVRVGGEETEVTVEGLEPGHKYKMNLYGLHGGRRVGPVSTVAMTAREEEPPASPPLKPHLGELTVTDATPDSLSLSWTVPEGQFDHFLVQYKNGDGQPKVVRVPGDEDGVTISGLEPDHKYKMNLYGFHDRQRVGPVSTVGLTVSEKDQEMTPAPTDLPTAAPEPPIKPRLGELAVTDATPDSLSLSWTVPEGQFDHFLIQYKNGDGQPKAVRVPGDEDEVTISGLEPDHKYKMNLYGFHDRQRVGPISVIGVTTAEEETPGPTEMEQTPSPTEVEETPGPTEMEETPSPTEPSTEAPEPPEEPLLGELTVTGSSPDSLSLSWTVPQGHFDSFTIQHKGRDGPQVVRVGGEETEVTIGGLEPGRKYKMNLYGLHSGQRVGPVSAVGVTDPQEVVEETPSPTEPSTEAPEPPEEPLLGDLTVTGSSPDSLSLSWTVPQGHFDSFTIQYKGRDGPQVVRVGGEETEVTIGGLEPRHKYKMNLYGLHGGQRVGPVSTVGVTASLTTERPLAPRLGELAVAVVTSDTARLSWTVEQGPFDSFLVQYKDVQGQPQAVPVAGDLREVTVSSLAPGRKYKFLLFGLQDEKRHGPVSADAKTLPDTKPAPRLGELTVTDVTPDSVGLSWTVPEGEFDSFVVQYKDRDGQPRVVPVAADQREVTVPGLEPNRKYKFLLYGLVGRKRLGPISAEGSTAPLKKERQPPPRLGELTVTDETPNSLRLSWTVAQGRFDSFVVQYRGTDGQPRMVPVAADQREFTVEGLEPGRKYKFLLYGLLGGQRLGPASVLGMTAPEEDTPAPWHAATEAPKPPEGPRLGVLAVRDVSPDSLRLSWSVVQGPFDSFVVQYQDTDGQPQALLVGGDQNKVLVSGLEPSTSYEFFLYGLHEGKRLGPVSAEGTTGPVPAGQTPGEPGPRLSHLSVTDVTTSSLRLNWEAPPEAFDSFLLRFGVPSPSTLEPQLRPLLQRELTVPGTRRSAVLRDLHPGTLYTLTLYGLRGPHKADSIQGTARTLSPVLESPRDLQFSEIRETSARVSWTPPTSRVDGFKVSYQLADGGEPQSVQVDGRTQKLEGLIPGAQYEVTVVSVRGFEESEPLTGFLTTVPDGPTHLRALNLTDESALLHWKPPQTPVDTYDVKVTAPGAPSLQASAPGSAVDYPLQGLVTHTNYTATLRGLRGPNFTSPASITFTTGLEAPQDLEAKEVTPRTALLTWTAPEVSPTGYLLSFNTPGGQTQEILLPGGVTSHQLRGLFPSTPYSTWLRAMWGDSFTPPVSTSFTTGGLRIPFPRDCGEEMQNGVSTSRTTTIFLNGNRERPLNVFCDMETDGGGWLVFQRRMDGKTDFWRDWEDYAHGFGNISGEFWLGNEALHSLTKAGDYSLRVDLRAGDEAVFAQYDSFQVDSADEYYRLHLEGYHGTAGDSMSYHSGSVFSARDRDPNNLLISCAVSYRGAWWYRNCHYANLNGLYGSTVDHQGVSWYYWKGFDFSVPFTEMKLRPRSYRPLGRGG